MNKQNKEIELQKLDLRKTLIPERNGDDNPLHYRENYNDVRNSTAPFSNTISMLIERIEFQKNTHGHKEQYDTIQPHLEKLSNIIAPSQEIDNINGYSLQSILMAVLDIGISIGKEDKKTLTDRYMTSAINAKNDRNKGANTNKKNKRRVDFLILNIYQIVKNENFKKIRKEQIWQAIHLHIQGYLDEQENKGNDNILKSFKYYGSRESKPYASPSPTHISKTINTYKNYLKHLTFGVKSEKNTSNMRTFKEIQGFIERSISYEQMTFILTVLSDDFTNNTI